MTRACVVCGATRSTSVAGPRRSDGLELLRCSACGTVFASTAAADFPAELYDYYRALEGKPREALYDPLNDLRYAELLSELGSLVTGRRLLDVGCGIGQWVDAAGRRGWQAEGIELAEGAVRVARGLGVPVQRLPLESPSLAPASFDVLTMFEVIEHVSSPRLFLRRGAELLRPGGILLMTMPNLRSVDRFVAGIEWAVIHPEHFTYFTPRTMRALVALTGMLDVVQLRTQNVSPSLLMDRVRRSLARGAPAGAEGAATPSAADQALRGTIERSVALRFAKRALNRGLDVTGLGSAMTVWCRRRA